MLGQAIVALGMLKSIQSRDSPACSPNWLLCSFQRISLETAVAYVPQVSACLIANVYLSLSKLPLFIISSNEKHLLRRGCLRANNSSCATALAKYRHGSGNDNGIWSKPGTMKLAISSETRRCLRYLNEILRPEVMRPVW